MIEKLRHERGLFARTKLGHLRFLRPDDMGLVGAVRSAHRGEAKSLQQVAIIGGFNWGILMPDALIEGLP